MRSILNFGLILLCFLNMEHCCDNDITTKVSISCRTTPAEFENANSQIKNFIDYQIKIKSWSCLCDFELTLNATRKELDEKGQNHIDVTKKYIADQSGENYIEIENACLYKRRMTLVFIPVLIGGIGAIFLVIIRAIKITFF